MRWNETSSNLHGIIRPIEQKQSPHSINRRANLRRYKLGKKVEKTSCITTRMRDDLPAMSTPTPHKTMRTIARLSTLTEHYTRDRYPTLLAMSGPWEIRSNPEGLCAAIPSDPASGHLPSAYGTVRCVHALIRRGEVAPI
jgi:hypothetical protein